KAGNAPRLDTSQAEQLAQESFDALCCLANARHETSRFLRFLEGAFLQNLRAGANRSYGVLQLVRQIGSEGFYEWTPLQLAAHRVDGADEPRHLARGAGARHLGAFPGADAL